MAQLRQDYPKFTEKQTEIITVGPESADAFAKWWQEHQMPFIGIPDPKHEIANLYSQMPFIGIPDPKHEIANLYSQEFKIFKGGRLPAMMVIDKNGKIRFMHYADLPSDIPPNEDILALLDKINTEATSK